MTLADILVVMNGGQVEQIGNPLDIYQKPATTFVASFIGAPPMNLMPLRSDELKSQLNGEAASTKPAFSASGRRISSSRARRYAGGVALGLTVEAIERVGAETFIYGTRQQEVQGVAANPGELPPGEIIVRIPGAVGPAIGERIRAVAPPRQAASVYRRRPQAGRLTRHSGARRTSPESRRSRIPVQAAASRNDVCRADLRSFRGA